MQQDPAQLNVQALVQLVQLAERVLLHVAVSRGDQPPNDTSLARTTQEEVRSLSLGVSPFFDNVGAALKQFESPPGHSGLHTSHLHSTQKSRSGSCAMFGSCRNS